MDKTLNSDWKKEQKKQLYYKQMSETLTPEELSDPSLYQHENIDIEMTLDDMPVDEFIATTREWVKQQLEQIKNN